jgi:hypothetical protein
MAMGRILAETGHEHVHRERLEDLLQTTNGPVRIATAYVTDTGLLFGNKNRKIQLLTSISPMDIVCGATSVSALRNHIEAGVECRRASTSPRLHAKVYIFGNDAAIVTSANLTTKGLNDNIEVGVELVGDPIRDLLTWFKQLWSNARRITLAQLSKWEQETAALRRQYVVLRNRVRERSPLRKELPSSSAAKPTLQNILHGANRFFICNTNRRWSAKVEQLMRHKKYAAAWESFNFPSHMKKVQPGDVIFMYAKGVGIVGVGRAKAKHEILESQHPDRISDPRDNSEREWRVPVDDWFTWVDDDLDAYRCKIHTVSFIDASGENYRDLREGIAKHPW